MHATVYEKDQRAPEFIDFYNITVLNDQNDLPDKIVNICNLRYTLVFFVDSGTRVLKPSVAVLKVVSKNGFVKENKTVMTLSFSLAVVKDDDSKSAGNCKDIPEDILIEILVRLPAYSLMRFKCVSKLWSSLISSRYFTDLFFNFSSSSTKRKSRVFIYQDDYILFSLSLSNLDTTATAFPTLNLDLTFPCLKKDRLQLVNALRGLMCFKDGRGDIRIINSTTKQVLSLPLLEHDGFSAYNYFGYASVNDEYKVLSIISPMDDETSELRTEPQVLVLGEGASWRNTECFTSSPPPPHDPDGGGISINGCVLYYGASSRENRSVLMSFDFNSEDFNLIELSLEYRIKLEELKYIVELMNYQDQVAVFDDSRLNTECILDLWMLEDAAKSKWSHQAFVLPCHQIRASLNLYDMDELYIRGTSRSGEVILWEERYVRSINKSSYYAFYDLEKNRITRGFVIDSRYPNSCFVYKDIWDDDVESIMYLEA